VIAGHKGHPEVLKKQGEEKGTAGTGLFHA